MVVVIVDVIYCQVPNKKYSFCKEYFLNYCYFTIALVFTLSATTSTTDSTFLLLSIVSLDLFEIAGTFF